MVFPLRIGTRGSPLALVQARDVADRLRAAHPEMAGADTIEIRTFKTSGDRMQSGPLADLGGKGLFTKEIEEALLADDIDLAVHSMKDVPTVLPAGLGIAALLPREDARDALISPRYRALAELPEGSVVGTSSLRRRAQLLAVRPDLSVVDFRGNVGTRIDKLSRGEAEATLLAVAGLNRLGRTEHIAAILSEDDMLPAVCQGIVGIETREDDSATQALLAPLNDNASAVEAAAERALLAALDGSCRTPIAARAHANGGRVTLRGQIISHDGRTSFETSGEAGTQDAATLGQGAGEELRARGGPGFFD